MSATDAAFRRQVEADALACGWNPAVAALLAQHVGKGTPKARPSPKGNAPGPTLEQAVQWFGLPPGMAEDLRAAGMPTAQSAAPLLRAYLAQSARSPVAAASALGMRLLTRRVFGKKAHA